ncbi:hypothetical protein CQ10_29975 [Bradyrhizobium valentinum]|nr:hypothetical protein CQ10_29975 [Bradyrhizobium valentinum]
MLGDRRKRGDRHLAEQPLDVILLGIAESAMSHDGLPRSIVTGARAKQSCAIGFGPAGLAAVVEPHRSRSHLPGCLKIHPALGQWMLDALILADRAIEHYALPGVARRAAQGVLSDPDGFDRDQDPLGIEAMQDVGKALSLLTDPVRIRNEEAIDEDGVGIHRLASHLGNAVVVPFTTIGCIQTD